LFSVSEAADTSWHGRGHRFDPDQGYQDYNQQLAESIRSQSSFKSGHRKGTDEIIASPQASSRGLTNIQNCTLRLSHELLDERRREPYGTEQIGVNHSFRIDNVSRGQVFDPLDSGVVDEDIQIRKPFLHFISEL
jgi:hypothetical protein